jgi:ketosteroid isomerase-like protein
VMAPSNLDLVRSILAANERGDYSSTEWAHPEIEFVVADGPSPGRWTGVAGMTEGWLDMANAWEELRTVVDEYRQLDDERVLVLLRRSGRGKTSGLELGGIGSEGAGMFHVRDGEVTRLVVYFDRERTLADLGLKE